MSVLDTLGSVKEYIGWDKHQIDDAIFRQGFSIKLCTLKNNSAVFLLKSIDCNEQRGHG